jgi:hypothetical protein
MSQHGNKRLVQVRELLDNHSGELSEDERPELRRMLDRLLNRGVPTDKQNRMLTVAYRRIVLAKKPPAVPDAGLLPAIALNRGVTIDDYRRVLETTLDRLEEVLSTDPDMPSHARTLEEAEKWLEDCRAALTGSQ